MTLLHGDSLEQLKTLPDNSVDSLVTDPPAGISFMGSGSTGVAAVGEGYQFAGIEREAEYLEIAKKRVKFASAVLRT